MSNQRVEASLCAPGLHFYASVVRVGANAEVTSDLDFFFFFLQQNTTRVFYNIQFQAPTEVKHTPAQCAWAWSKWSQEGFRDGGAWMELSASRVCRLWIFGVFLRGNCPTGWGGLQGEGESQLLHRPEQRVLWVHQEKNGVLLWYLLPENRRLLRGLSACVPNIWWVACSLRVPSVWYHPELVDAFKAWKLKIWDKLTKLLFGFCVDSNCVLSCDACCSLLSSLSQTWLAWRWHGDSETYYM